MSQHSLSRRSFVALAGAAPAAAQTATRRDEAAPIRIVTMYAFEPDEVRKIQSAAPNHKVEIVMAKNRDEFHTELREAEVVYGDMKGPTWTMRPS